ncbi:hypothetical protein C2G38_2117574, partial [Gigaspora rosea]
MYNMYNMYNMSCQILSSTFNRINSNYTIVVDDNFVTSLFNEPLRGIKKGVWNVMTSKSYNSVISDSTEALLRLNSDGSSYFSSYNQSQLLDDLLQQIKESIPLMNDQLKITHSVQSDPSDFSKLLIEFSISKATDPLNDPSVNSIIKDLDIMIKNKYISALSDKKFMIFLDDQYGFQVKPNLWAEIRYKLLALVTFAFVLFVIYFWAQWYYPKGQNFIIFKLSLMILDLFFDCLFIIENGHDISFLFIPSLVLLIVSLLFNLGLSFFYSY